MQTETHQTNNHPPSLRVFFATEMWERYGFYVVQSLLALYLALHFHWADQKIYALVGSFTALTYLSPVIGGWIADQFLGQRITILIGAICLFLSYLVLSLVHHEQILPVALAGIAVGTGLLKPNISSLLGNQYPLDSTQREAGFTIFYMGITSGIILGTTVPSQLNQHFGWSMSFASAAIGMLISFFTFLVGSRLFHIQDYRQHQYTHGKLCCATILILSLLGFSTMVLRHPHLADLCFLSVVVLSAAYLSYTIKKSDAIQAKKTIIIGLLCIISALFWAFYFQMFMAFILFIARVVKPVFLGIQFHPPYYVALQSIGMLFFGYFLARKKTKNDSRQRIQQTNNKFLSAMILMCAAYGLITWIASMNPAASLISPAYFIPAYLLISLAELLLSPVGLAAITTLATRDNVSTMMGLFFISLGIGAFLSGKLADLTAIDTKHLSLVQLKLSYAHGFQHLFLLLLLSTVISGILHLLIKKLLKQLA